MSQIAQILFFVAAGIAAIIGLSFLLSFPVYLLWNGCLVGAVTIVAPVTWPQAWGISILCAFLFKNTVSKAE